MNCRSLLLTGLSALTVTGATACADSNAPDAGLGSYDLVSYGGEPLPVVLRLIVGVSPQPGGPTVSCEDRLTASTLELLGSNRFTQTDSGLLVCDDGRPDAPSQGVRQGTYSAAADTITLDIDAGGGTHYVQTARRSNGTLTIYRRQAVVTGGVTTTDPTRLVFRQE